MRINPQHIIIKYNQGMPITDIVYELGVSQATVYRWIKRSRSAYTRKPSSRGLKRKGYIKDQGRHRRPYIQNTVHMHARNVTTIGYLQMDVKYLTPQLTGLPWTCYEYAIIDIYSRYKDVVILNHLDHDGAIAALSEMLKRLPFTPVFIQTDNGLEFQSRFKEFCSAQGLKHHYIHKRSPNENAVIERSFRTDQDEFLYRRTEAFTTYGDLRSSFTSFLHHYNTVRPHFGINLKTPMEVIIKSLVD